MALSFRLPQLRFTRSIPDIITFRDNKTDTDNQERFSGIIKDSINILAVYFNLEREDTIAAFEFRIVNESAAGIYKVFPKDEDPDEFYSPMFSESGTFVYERSLPIQNVIPALSRFRLDLRNTANPVLYTIQIQIARLRK